MLRRARFLAIAVALLAGGTLPVAWAATSRVQQARVRRIKACVLRIPSMGEAQPLVGLQNPFPYQTSAPDPDAILSESPDPPPAGRGRSTARNQLLFYTLDRRQDMKPDGWEFYNPAAPPYATLDISQRFLTSGGQPVYPQGSPIKVNTAPYWEVVLNEGNYNVLSEMDVIYIPISRVDPTKRPMQDIPIPTFFTEEQRRVLTRLADSGVTLWIDWTVGNATADGALGGSERIPPTTPADRNKNAFFTNLDFATASGAVADISNPLPGHPLLNGPYVISDTDAAKVGSQWDPGNPAPSLSRALELRGVDMQPTANFTAVVPTTAGPPLERAYIAAARFGAGYVVATAGNVGGALGSTTSAETEDLKFGYNVCAWATEVTAQQKNARHTGQSGVEINGMIEQWAYPHLTQQSGGLWEQYPPRTMLPSALPVNPISPLIINGVVISTNLYQGSGGVVSEINAFDIRAEDDFNSDGNADDPVAANASPGSQFSDLQIGQSYDRLMGAPLSGAVYGMTVGEVPDGATTAGTKPFIYAAGFNGLFSLPAPRPGMPATDFWNLPGVVKSPAAAFPGLRYTAAPGFAVLPGTLVPTGAGSNYTITRQNLYAGGVISNQAFGSSFNGKVVAYELGANGVFGNTNWYYPPAQESNRMGLLSGPIVTANVVDEGTGAIDTMVFVTSCASGDVSGGQNPNGAGDTTGKVEGFIVATRGDVLTFPKANNQANANTPNYGRRFVSARWLDIPPGQGQVPQARELMWDATRYYEVRVMDKERNHVFMRFVSGSTGFNVLPDGTAGQVELPPPPTGFSVPNQPGVWDLSKYVLLADYSVLPQPVDSTGATIRPRFSPPTPYVRTNQQTVIPTGVAGGVSVGADNRIYYGTGMGYMCSVEWNRGRPTFPWKIRGLGADKAALGTGQEIDPAAGVGYLPNYAFTSAPAAGRRIVYASRQQGVVYVLEPDAVLRGKLIPPSLHASGATMKWPLTALTGNEVMVEADHGVGFNPNSAFIRSNQQPWGRVPNQFSVDPDTQTITFNNMENFSMDLNFAKSAEEIFNLYQIDTQGKPAIVMNWKFTGDQTNTNTVGQVIVPLPLVAVYRAAAGEQFMSGPVISGDRIYIMGASGVLHEFPLDPKSIDPSFPKRTGIVGLNGYDVGNGTLYPGMVRTRNIAAGAGMPPTVAPPAIGDRFVAINTPRGLTAYSAPNVLVADSNRIVEATGDSTAVASTDVVVKHKPNLSDFALPIDPPAGTTNILTERQFLNRPAVVRKLNRSGSLTAVFASTGPSIRDTTDAANNITESSVLADESYLAADTGNNRVVEFNPAGKVVGEWTAFQDPFNLLPAGESLRLSGPMDVQRWVETERLTGTNEDIYVIHTLIADTGNTRVVEIVDKVRAQAGNFNSRSYVTVPGQVGADGQLFQWYHVVVWSTQTNAQGLKLRYRTAQRVYWPDGNGSMIPVPSVGSGPRVASTTPPYLPDERFLSYTMATVQGATVQYPATGVTVTGYNQYYGAPIPATVTDRVPQVRPGNDSIVFLRGRYKLDESGMGAQIVPAVREAKPGALPTDVRYRFAQGVIDPNVPIITELADEMLANGSLASPNPTHKLNGVSSVQRTIRADVKFAPWTYTSSTPVRYPYFLIADVDGVWECRMLPGTGMGTSRPQFALTLAFTNEDYAYVTGAGNGDPTQIYSTSPASHDPGGRRFSAASARRMPNGLILVTSRTGANDQPPAGMSTAFYHWRAGADVFLLRSSDYLTATERAARSLAVPYNRQDVSLHGWQADLWVQSQYAGNVPAAMRGAPSIRWRAAEPANPTAKPVQRTQFTAPGANPADLFGSYQPQQPAFADLVY